MLHLYRASAGSGKTYLLTQFFLYLMLSGQKFAFKKILAITFTNKAAQEMKHRVLSALKKLSHNKPEDFAFMTDTLQFFSQRNCVLNAEVLQKKAQDVLYLILHNYSDFSVSTIDKFNHKIIRSFSKELDLSYQFEVEMDKNSLAQEAIELLLEQIGTDKALSKMILQFSLSNLEEDKKWDISATLFKFWQDFQGQTDRFAPLQKMTDQDFDSVRNRAIAIIHNFEKNIQETLKPCTAETLESGKKIVQNDILKYFKKLLQGDFSGLSIANYACAKVEENNCLVKTLTKAKQAASVDILAKLMPIYENLQTILKENFKTYRISQYLKDQLFSMALFVRLERVIGQLKTERSLLFIDEFNDLIAQIIADEPIPFIYEKLGEKYDHFLIDEFQDTSILQWQNILPLVENSLSKENFNLLVGDAKQAIYRFRGGEVDQFVDLSKAEKNTENPKEYVKNFIQTFQLDSNWRSSTQIIDFNNFIFKYFLENKPEFSDYYRDYFQHVPQNKPQNLDNSAYVALALTEEDHFTKVLATIQENIEKGYRYADIALLFKSNNTANIYARQLSELNIPVVSAESLILAYSTEVSFLVSCLELLQDENNVSAAIRIIRFASLDDLKYTENIAKYMSDDINSRKKIKIQSFLWDNYQKNIEYFKHVYNLSSMVVKLADTFGINRTNNSYVLCFLEEIAEFEQKKQNDLAAFLAFWEKRKSKSALKASDESNAIQIMTIHKSKGLEFNIVILPEFWLQDKTQKKHFWIENPIQSVFSEFPYLFVPTHKNYEDLVPQAMAQEKNALILDNLNLIYVALTRPKERLYIFTSEKNTKYSSSNLLVAAVQKHPAFNTEMQTLSLGKETNYRENTANKSSENPSDSLKEKKESNHFKKPTLVYKNTSKKIPQKQQEQGILIHKILSKINGVKDLDIVLNKHQEKTIHVESIRTQMMQILTHPDLAPWFDAQNTNIFNEQAIVMPLQQTGVNHRVCIPDKIICQSEKTLVIDYKTGKKSPAHIAQVEEYIAILKAMKFPNVQGALVYLNSNKPNIVELLKV